MTRGKHKCEPNNKGTKYCSISLDTASNSPTRHDTERKTELLREKCVKLSADPYEWVLPPRRG